MLHKKCFNVSNRWYAPDLRVSKMAIVASNFSVMEEVFFLFFLCNLSESVRKSTNWFFGVLWKVPTKSVSEDQGLYNPASSLVLELLEHGSRDICKLKDALRKACSAQT